MASLNRVFLIGNVGQSPEVKTIASGDKIVKLSLATSDGKTTTWHNLVLFGKQADVAAQYVVKGTSIHVEGRISVNEWAGTDGVKKSRTEIIVERITLLGGKPTIKDFSEELEALPTSKIVYDGASSVVDDSDDIPFK